MMKNVSLLIVCSLIFTLSAFSQSGDGTYRFTILHTNDEHSHLIPHPVADYHPEYGGSAVGGFARLAGAINQIRAEKEQYNEPVMIFSGGDILGGPAFGWLPLKEGVAAEMKLFQAIGYDAVTIGNHEFDYGPDVLANYLKAAGYPEASSKTVFLGTNTRPPADHPLSDLGIKKHYIKELDNGLTIGVLGLLGDDAINKTAVPGPVEFDDPIEAARQAVEELKAAGADLIISVNHSGVYEDRLLAREVPDINIIVGGHTHTALYEPVFEGETVIVQAGSYLRYLGRVEFEWIRGENKITVLNEENGNEFLIPLDSSVEPDEEIAAKVEEYRSLLNGWVAELTDGLVTHIEQPVARSNFSLTGGRFQQESTIGNYVTDAMLHAAREATGNQVDVAAQANGAIRANVRPGVEEWSEGLITFYDLIMATGLGSGDDGNPGYPLVSFYLTEDEMRRALEVSVLLSELLDNSYFLQFSGLRMAFDPNRAVLLRIPFRGTPIPTSRAVLSAELQTGDGEFRPLRRGSDELIHVVTDRYIAGFLPLVGEIVPNLSIQFRDESGNPVELDDTIIRQNGEELKVWQAVLNFTLSHQVREVDLPEIPARYETTEERMRAIYTLPLWVWPLAIVVVIAAFVMYIIRRRRSIN
ncbi:MAG: bifunctional metallophosphatase/5'-nucleotidase [Balneolaceae bacterium]|nr:MAG: bifunctional metallophosphatase/5'-nucleotidase [Balneolaceae bacterium]